MPGRDVVDERVGALDVSTAPRMPLVSRPGSDCWKDSLSRIDAWRWPACPPRC
jgi:hypothetical protein